jgi:hypothetical protein
VTALGSLSGPRGAAPAPAECFLGIVLRPCRMAVKATV